MLRVRGEAAGERRSTLFGWDARTDRIARILAQPRRHDATVPDQGKLWVELGASTQTGDGGGMASFGAEFDRHFEAT